jgi:carboxyl-terminal processing protease
MTRKKSDSLRKQDVQTHRAMRIMLVFICICFAFVCGFILRGNPDALHALGFSTTIADEEQNPGMTVSGSTYDALSARIAEFEGIISGQSIDSLDLDRATNDMLQSASGSVDDSYLRYYDESHYESYLKDTSKTYTGIGVLFGEYEGKAYVTDVFAGSEAEGKGIQSGDFIVAIDGDRGQNGWSQIEVTKKIAQSAGEEVVLTLRRPATIDADGGTEYTVTVECSDMLEANVTTELVNDNVGYIKLSQVTQNSASLVRQAVSSLMAEGAQSYVLDLRDNPGGYLTQSVDLTSLFVKSGVVAEIQTKQSLVTKTASGSTVTDAPLVVLVNKNTAAAAEVIAGGLQDNKRATIVGETTQGKGSVQSIQELSWGGALRFTSAAYKTPLGHTIDGVGIKPNVQVALDSGSSTDNQKTLAVDTASSLVR